MDVIAEFEVFGGASIVILNECKHHKNPIKRETIMVLESKLRDTKAHKAMLFTTSSFQKGALTFAKTHRIGTVVVRDGLTSYLTRKFDGITIRPEWLPKCVGWLISFSDDNRECFSLISNQDTNKFRNWILEDSL